nr:EOG090X00E0 [Triops cancriformis]
MEHISRQTWDQKIQDCDSLGLEMVALYTQVCLNNNTKPSEELYANTSRRSNTRGKVAYTVNSVANKSYVNFERMGKLKPRNKSASTGKRWAKGHSCSSNPEQKKHRLAAKSGFLFGGLTSNQTSSNLTVQALQQHTSILQGEEHFVDEDGKSARSSRSTAIVEDDAISVSSAGTSKTFKTFASGWTDCSNISFNRLFRSFTPTSAMHKEMLAVLAAITEVIKLQGGKESETEYFAALMVSLEVAETEDSLAAILSLLGMVIKRVPSPVLKKQFSSASKSFLDMLGKHADSDHHVIVRSLIGCLSVLLRAQDVVVWNHSSTLQVFDALLAFSIHMKPKVRKAAQHAVCAVLKGSSLLIEGDNPPTLHPASGHTAKFFIRFLEENGQDASGSIMQTLNLLKDILGILPLAQVKTLCEILLRLMTLGQVVLTSCCMQALHGLLSANARPVTLNSELNARLITALYDYQPGTNDVQPTIAWLTVMQQAHVNLAKLDVSLCLGHLSKFFTTACNAWLSERAEIFAAVTSNLSSVLVHCLQPALDKEGPDHAGLAKSVAEKIVDSVEKGLRFQYLAAWKHVIELCTTLIEVVGKYLPTLLCTCLQSLADLRVSPRFAYEAEVDFAVGKAVRVMGPRIVLRAIPLQITGHEDNYDFPRSWLLPVLRENIGHTELGYYIEYFLPLTEACRARSLRFAKESNPVGAKTYDLLQRQIWGLLPGFCKSPTDVLKSFKVIARTLGVCLTERPDIRMDLMAGLRQLLLHTDQEAGAATEVARFAKNFLPLLFNIYTAVPSTGEEENQRRATYETIKLYLKVSDDALRHSLFDKALSKFENMEAPGGKKRGLKEDTNRFTWESLLDLLRALVVYQDVPRIQKLFGLCLPWLNGKDAKAQKKAYRLLEELLASQTEVCASFVQDNAEVLQKLLLEALSSSEHSSKAARLKCLSWVVKSAGPEKRAFVEAVIPEAVLCVKEIGEKARAAAYILLVDIGQTLQRWTGQSAEDTLREYLKLLFPGLSGDVNTVSSTVLALAHVLHEFKALFPEDLLSVLLEQGCGLVQSNVRQITLAALGLLKMFVVVLTGRELPSFLRAIVHAMSDMREDLKKAYRNRTRDILDRLIRKCGAEVVLALIPSDDQTLVKRVNNLKKLQVKKKKQRLLQRQEAEAHEQEDFALKAKPKSIDDILAESDEDEEGDEVDKGRRPRQSAKAWIQEKSEDIIDFLDPKTTQFISSTKPGIPEMAAGKKAKDDFRRAPDGRLIILDESDDESDTKETKGKKRKESTKQDLDLDASEVMEAMAGLHVARKRKMTSAASETDELPAMKYQAGGSGIHRPVAASEKQQKVEPDYGVEYRSSKAQGDVKRKGKPDPFAYVPLQRQSMNKRKKAKFAGCRFDPRRGPDILYEKFQALRDLFLLTSRNRDYLARFLSIVPTSAQFGVPSSSEHRAAWETGQERARGKGLSGSET